MSQICFSLCSLYSLKNFFSGELDGIVQCPGIYSALWPIIPERKDVALVLGMALMGQGWVSFQSPTGRFVPYSLYKREVILPEKEGWGGGECLVPVNLQLPQSNFWGLFTLVGLTNTWLYFFTTEGEDFISHLCYMLSTLLQQRWRGGRRRKGMLEIYCYLFCYYTC